MVAVFYKKIQTNFTQTIRPESENIAMPTTLPRRRPPITVKTLLVTAIASAREIRLGWDVRTVALLVIGVCLGCASVLHVNPDYLSTNMRLHELADQADGIYWFWAYLGLATANSLGILLGTESCPGGKINPLMASPFAVRFWLIYRCLVWFFSSVLFWLVAKLLSHQGVGWGTVFHGVFGIACTINLKVVGQTLFHEVLNLLYPHPSGSGRPSSPEKRTAFSNTAPLSRSK